MPFITRQQVNTAARRLDEARVKIAKTLTDKDVFLSHSHLDNDLVVGALGILEAAGGSVYVDVNDGVLQVVGADAKVQRVRDAVARCPRLVVLASKNAATSKWIPWELGLGDGQHGLQHVATFPVGDDSSEADWGTQEYFGVYPQVRYSASTNDFVVYSPSTRTSVALRDWLRRGGGALRG